MAMNFLRRRFAGDSSTEVSREVTPEPDKKDASRVITAKKLHSVHKSRNIKRRNIWIFGLGGLFGVAVAAFFAGSNDMIDLSLLADMNLDSILDALPAGLVRDAQEIQKHERDAVNYDSFAVGLHARSQGIAACHPVIMIPGVISTGLESWGTEENSRPYFRKRLWGSWTMMRALVLDKPGWKRHIMLDKETGLDPPGIKLRAAQGFDATDFFITGYWIWNKILENLATIGYDPTNAFTAAYDWRLSYANYENRDQYYTRLKAHIEIAVRVSKKKVVLLSHSMGSQVLYYFFHWVEAEGYGNGGPNWVDTYVDSWINISGCMLGALKGLPAVLSGEMKDTAQLNAFAVYGLEKFLSRHERAEIFRAMPGISSMIPMGGNAVWGDENWAPDDQPGQNNSFGNFIRFRDNNSTYTAKNLTVSDAFQYLLDHSDTWYKDMVINSYSYGVAHSRREVEDNQLIPAKWVNPLETRLPLAPHLKIYCFYGVGKETERAYYYKEDLDPLNMTNVTIDTAFTNGDVDHGVVMGEGDGTVNLLSAGYMCAKGWKIRRYNPAGVKIRTFEMPHEPDRFSPRGGPNTGDHVDILGRSSLNDLILRVAGGKGELIEETVSSRILEYAEKVRIYDDDA
ncbi:phospholipid:diacylglycerol acyltransferas-like protein [Lepidopterella palustris CBS 459.81]|uniref:Phospholipid:diacylglycerol acyltransferas-like protein n=1 Tax=Lepidopterella palustris CBS 459.81 TaxID=1314670 RepID=A0A8E2JBR4_9PEZI|nr:phospholipid:diacylglycerol acyltransferas-like protein [Lepidopterella palustris CBS 459.81]